MIQWRITGMFCKPDLDNNVDVVRGAQWYAWLLDETDPNFPRRSEMMGTHTFTTRRINSDAKTEDDVIQWMVEEGFNKEEVESQLQAIA